MIEILKTIAAFATVAGLILSIKKKYIAASISWNLALAILWFLLTTDH